MHNIKKKVFPNVNNEQQCQRCRVNVYICTHNYVSSSKRVVGDFQLTTLTFKMICLVDPKPSGILLKTLHSFRLKLAPKFSFIRAFWLKRMWDLQTGQPTQPESLTQNILEFALFPVESFFYLSSCHIHKSNAFFMIIHCQWCVLHCAIYNTAGRDFSRDKVCGSLAKGVRP